MKAILEFNLPEEEFEYRVTVSALRWRNAMWDLAEFLRHKSKHGELSDDQDHLLDEIRDKLYDRLQEDSISFDD